MKKYFLSGILAITICNLFAQYKETKKDVYPVYVNYQNFSVRADVLADKVKISPKKDYSYFWYSSNKILETKGGFDGKLLHGEYKSFYYNNNLREKGTFKKGLKNGEWIAWFENGLINEVTNWDKGEKEGFYKLYSEKGELVQSAYFRNGKLHGSLINYQSDKIVSEKKYRNGIEKIKVPKEKKQNKEAERNSEKDIKVIRSTDNQTSSKDQNFFNKLKSKLKKSKSGKDQKPLSKDNKKPKEKQSLKSRIQKLFKKDKNPNQIKNPNGPAK